MTMTRRAQLLADLSVVRLQLLSPGQDGLRRALLACDTIRAHLEGRPFAARKTRSTPAGQETDRQAVQS